ncbi:endolytic transglycosylase MltG [Erysipelothrix rhusiopathiae]|nr:endolytic transglycosylase MltG [Erysipelothrix rhusiopathiae]MDE8092377.1 endolytic transglycosylase MltG [Erysipelothrix rhusiopathiae]MDE8097351.1 endolytic transglycosylase MltG [Erysipelothrix rhusiopathiae]MDE8107373.1 endolytic transglycosylase MltG [Erysipelothrix rhusiopathiae]MDE8160911.1 endolytic transglycosylase MltG [Erysipelothrix rhusiopathiae]
MKKAHVLVVKITNRLKIMSAVVDVGMTTHTKKILGGLLLVCVIVVIGFMLLFNINTQSISKDSQTVLFNVNEGDTMSTVIDRLADDGIVRSAFFTKIKAKLGHHDQLYEGQFNLDKSWDVDRILEYLEKPSYEHDKTGSVTITLIEGSWAKDIAKKIASETNTTAERFLELWNDPKYIESLMSQYEVLSKDLLKNKDAKVLLEGYLYPDTYEFNANNSEEEITERLIANGNDKYQNYKDQIDSLGMTPYQLFSLASIVEYEAPGYENMQDVAGVFMNRLKQGMKLESSVTICYALYEFEDWDDCESMTNNQIDSPYNTYRYEGITPGPILNPSQSAIEAVINYSHHDYLFFVANVKADKNDPDYGKIYYSKTFEEHDQRVKEILN